MEMVKISVVIPVHNCERYLNEAVYSALNQPYDAIDIVLVDDGSTDGSSALCDELATLHSNISVIHQANAGVSAARNRGIEYVLSRNTNVCGGYIAFLDADDAWLRNFFTNDSVAEFPNVQIILNRSIDCNTTLKKGRPFAQIEEGIYQGGQEMVPKCLGQHFGAALYSCHLLRERNIRFVEGLRHSEDVLFLKKCIFTADSIALSNKPLYLYRSNPTSAVHNRDFGTAYFEPIFAAYLATDHDGKGYVCWYLVDMIEEHFRHFGSISSLRKWMDEHENYVQIARDWGGNRANRTLSNLEKHPFRYALKKYLAGAVVLIVRKTIRLRWISQLVERIRYPIPL